MKLTGAQIIIECLAEQGINTVFGYPGGSVLPLYDALYENSGRITHYLTADEQGASHAASGWARATGKTAVCIATSGPGATNLVTGIATSYLDSVPVVFITGNVPVSQIGTDGFQEVDITGITLPITKHNVIVKDIKKLASSLREAFCVAAEGRPGPVLVDIPKDVQTSVCEYQKVSHENMNSAKNQHIIDEESCKIASVMINKAENPVIIAGGGVVISHASDDLRRFSEQTGIPVAVTLMARGVLPSSHPLYLGGIGLHGTPASNIGVSEADLIIAIGTRFADRITGPQENFAKKSKIIHIDIDRSEINKNVNADCMVIGQASDVLQNLCRHCKVRKREKWLDFLRKQNEILRTTPHNSFIPKNILSLLSSHLDDDAYIATDVGQHQMWASMYLQFNKPGHFLTSGGMGTMGFGLGAAIGANIAFPSSKTVLITGDGSFRMNCNELATVSAYGLPIVIVLINNGVLGNVRQWQTLFYGKRYSQTVLDRGPDFLKLAYAYGVEGESVESLEDFDKACVKAFEKKRPYFIECRIGLDESIVPMCAPGKPISEFILL